MIGTNIFLAAGARLVYIITFLIFWRAIVQKTTKYPTNAEPNEAPFKYGQFWLRFAGKEFCLFAIGYLNNYAAVALVIYTALAVGRLGLIAFRTKSASGFGRGLLIAWGILWGLIAVSGAFLVAAYLYITQGTFGGELFAGVVGLVGFVGIMVTKKNWGISATSLFSLEQYIKDQSQSLWGRLKRPTKVGLIIALVVIPPVIAGLIVTRLFPQKIEDYMVPMRDGVHLRTRVVYPLGWEGEAVPVMLFRTPYNIDAMAENYGQYSIEESYAYALQDLRGMAGSEGIFNAFQQDATDGTDTVYWIMNQTWCNGKIAVWGMSAPTINQYCYQAEGPAGLNTAMLMMGSPDLYTSCFYTGGCFQKNLSESWLRAVNAYHNRDILLSHPTRDSYWTNVSLFMNQRYENVRVRGLHIGGWGDVFQQGTLDGYMYYDDLSTDYARRHQILVMGPWGHGIGNEHPGITFPKKTANQVSYNDLWYLMYKEGLEGKAIDWDTQPRVYYYVMGDPDAEGSTEYFNIWRTADDWPVPTTPQKWYFHPSGLLSPTVPDAGSAANRSFIFDPANPVRTIGGTTLVITYNGEPYNAFCDQRPVEYTAEGASRSDILKFTSETLTEPVEVVGRLSADLFIQSNCTDTDFTVKLMDIFPDGKELWVADGILKARYREGFEAENFLTPGITYELSIDMWSTAYRFTAGHQIRVSISSASFDKYSINDNTGGPVISELGVYYYANNTVLCGVLGAESSIIFPRT